MREGFDLELNVRCFHYIWNLERKAIQKYLHLIHFFLTHCHLFERDCIQTQKERKKKKKKGEMNSLSRDKMEHVERGSPPGRSDVPGRYEDEGGQAQEGRRFLNAREDRPPFPASSCDAPATPRRNDKTFASTKWLLLLREMAFKSASGSLRAEFQSLPGRGACQRKPEKAGAPRDGDAVRTPAPHPRTLVGPYPWAGPPVGHGVDGSPAAESYRATTPGIGGSRSSSSH